MSELSIAETRFDRQTHNHYTVTGEATQTNQIPEFFTGRVLTPRNPLAHQHQNLSTKVSADKNLPMAEQTPRNQNSDANNSIYRLVDSLPGIATRQRPQAATIHKPVSKNTIVLDGKNEKVEFFGDLFHTLLKMQPQMTEAMKYNHFHAHSPKEALQTLRNISALNKKNS